jgi:hypothetical protein
VVACASPPGGLVVDVFAGSGTTGESARALGRRFVLGDASPMALATARARLLRAGVPLVVQSCGETRAALRTAVGTGPLEPVQAVQGVSVRIERDGQGATVTLQEPSEPLAWAIDAEVDPEVDAGAEAAADASRTFRRTWHSERAPGTKPTPALRVAKLARVEGRLGIRVWLDDGRISSRIVEVP